MEQETILRKIGAALEALGIPYLITGGLAVTVWGRPRFTADIDIVIEIPPGKTDALVRSLKALGGDLAVDPQAVAEAVRARSEFNVMDTASGLKLDFWILRDDAFDRERMRRRVQRVVGGQSLSFISPEDLILVKLLWHKESGSTRHLEDIESIMRIQENLDRAYLHRWATQQSTQATLEALLATE